MAAQQAVPPFKYQEANYSQCRVRKKRLPSAFLLAPIREKIEDENDAPEHQADAMETNNACRCRVHRRSAPAQEHADVAAQAARAVNDFVLYVIAVGLELPLPERM